MKKVNPNNHDMLLPVYFRKIGEIMIVILVAALILVRSTGLAYLDKAPAFKMTTSALFIISLFFLAWSKEKEDDEQLRLFRLKAIKVTLFCCVIYFFVMSSLYTTGIYTAPQIHGMEQIIGLLLIYQLTFKLQKNVLK